MEKKIDENLYSRQIFTYGKETMDKIVNLKILIIGLRGLGIETAKNIILAGPKEVSISDKSICKINDLGANFYLNETDVNKNTLEESCINKLKELNPYVNVNIYKGSSTDDMKKYDIIIITEIKKLEEIYNINKFCRLNKKYFIYALNLGLTGFLFNDFGDEHYVYDPNGEKKISYNISYIEPKKDSYKIMIDTKEDEKLEFDEGDCITIKNVKGLEFLNNNEPKKIIKIYNNGCFEIEMKNSLSKENYISGGIVEEYKETTKLKFESFSDNFIKPSENFIKIDLKKNKTNILLHCAFVALHMYYLNNNSLPELNNLDQVEKLINLSENYYKVLKQEFEKYLKVKEKRKISLIEFDKNYLIKVFRWSKSELNPICSFLGGIISQEAIKVTGKYTPINQWLRFDFFEAIENIPNDVNRTLLNCRYDDQIAIFGQEFQEKLENLNIFMVGAGALGCEYIKNFGLMGISCKKGKLTVTDNDNISLSNLNRQFLFHKNDIGENSSKSFVAKREALKMNKDMNIKDYQLLVNDSTRDIFDDEFFESQDIIISAVDNIKARQYLDKKCTFYNKIFIDSGTEGTSANSDIYYPDKTICFNDLKIQEKKEDDSHSCTLKNFPTKIEHCIKFAKNVFLEIFEQDIRNIKLILEDEEHIKKILNEISDSQELYLSLEIYKNIINIINNPAQSSIIKFAIFIFIYYFEYNINLLLKELKESFNIPPTPLEININDENTLLYFESFYNICCDIFNLNKNYNINKIKNEIMKLKQNIKINNKIHEMKEIINSFENNELLIIKKNENNIQEKLNLINPIKFEKDDDENFHINFILSFSNLRASNYSIEPSNFLNAKEVAGNIIPAIASTTAAVTGIACLQIYTLLQTNNIKLFKNISFNLAISHFDLSTPEEKRYYTDIPETEKSSAIKMIPSQYTVWEKIDFAGPKLKPSDILKYFKDKYNVKIENINFNETTLISTAFNEDEDDDSDDSKNLEKSIEELIEEKTNFHINNKTKYVQLEVNGCDVNDEFDISTPTIRYFLKGNRNNNLIQL